MPSTRVGPLDIAQFSAGPRTKVQTRSHSLLQPASAFDIIPTLPMLQRVLSFVEQRLPLFLEKLSAFPKKLSAWAGWPREPMVDSVSVDAEALTKSLIKQRSQVRVAAGSPKAVTKDLHLATAERAGRAKPLKSTQFSITIRANGQEHTYDTTSGISDELASKLMDELGLPPEEFQTLVRLRQHGLQDAAACPSKNNAVLLTRCPRCGNELVTAGGCP